MDCAEAPHVLTIQITPTNDADVYGRYPNNNYGNDTSIYVHPYDSRRNRGFLKFDLNGIPEGATIFEAKLYLYAWRKRHEDFSAGAYGVDDDSWSEHTITWNNQPAYGYGLDDEWVAGTGWYAWEVTNFVRQEFAGDKTASFCLNGYPETEGGLAMFRSKEWHNSAVHPYLEVFSNDKEVGVEWVSDYPDPIPDLPAAAEIAEYFYYGYGPHDKGLSHYGWTLRFKHGYGTDSNGYPNYTASERYFEKPENNGWDSSYIDAVDFAWFCGHGSENYFLFATDNDGDGMYENAVWWHEAEWGDGDLEWIVIHACKVLYDNIEEGSNVFHRWGWPVFRGLHALLGFKTTSYSSTYSPEFVAYMTDKKGPYPITEAWKRMTIDYQPSDVRGAYLAELHNEEDYLPGYGTVYPDVNPPIVLAYMHWQC